MRCSFRLFGLIGSLTTFITACQNCGPSAEPTLQLNVAWATPGRLDTIYALGSHGRQFSQPYSTTSVASDGQFFLPINLNTDTSQYVFRQNGRQDTLTVFYRRNYSYRSKSCGYVIDLTAPSGQSARVSRGRIEAVGYEQNNYQTGLPSTGTRETGIFVSLRL
ncbi:DUF6452 family protein [Spirosoma koreense]